MACEHSVYCDEAMISDRSQGVYGFKSFVVKFMIRMAVVSRCGVCGGHASEWLFIDA